MFTNAFRSTILQKYVLYYYYKGMLLLLLAEEGTTVHKHHGKAQSRLALYVLNQLNLVPEHVETRALYNKTQQPTMEQVSLYLT